MASHAESEEQLGEHAPAGVPAIEADKKGDPARWEDMNRAESQSEETISTASGTVMQTPPRPGVGGEPEVGETSTVSDVTESEEG